MSLPAEPTGAAQSGLGTCGQCGWRGELLACRGCLEVTTSQDGEDVFGVRKIGA